MEIRELTCFVTVAEERSFVRAAEALHIVQPAVSQQVRKLERELGVRLFERSSRRVRLTGAGERLLPEVRAALDGIDRVRLLAGTIAAGTDGVLRLGTSQGLGERLERTLETLARTAPALRVSLVSAPGAERLAALRSGELDAAFVRGGTTADGLTVVPLWRDPVSAALPATHPLAAESTLRLEQLATMPLRLARREDNPSFYDLVLRACATAGFEPLLGRPFTSLQDTLAEIGTGTPMWTLLYAATAESTPARRVAFRAVPGLDMPTGLAIRPGPPALAVQRLLDASTAAGAPDAPVRCPR